MQIVDTLSSATDQKRGMNIAYHGVFKCRPCHYVPRKDVFSEKVVHVFSNGCTFSVLVG